MLKLEGTTLKSCVHKYADAWNASPQATISQLAGMFGVSRQWVSQVIIGAYLSGLVAETAAQRRSVRWSKRKERCARVNERINKVGHICAVSLHARMKVHADGNYYCSQHKHLCPSYRAARAEYMHRRYHNDPQFHQRILANSERYRKKKARCASLQPHP